MPQVAARRSRVVVEYVSLSLVSDAVLSEMLAESVLRQGPGQLYDTVETFYMWHGSQDTGQSMIVMHSVHLAFR